VAPAVPGDPGSSVRVLLGAAIVGGAPVIFDVVTVTAAGVVAAVACSGQGQPSDRPGRRPGPTPVPIPDGDRIEGSTA